MPTRSVLALAALNTLALASVAGAQAAPRVDVPEGRSVLVDARCEEGEWTGASRTALANGLELLMQQDDRRVYLCIPLPPDSYGTMDLYVLPAGAAMPTNLHASAQVGERQRTAAGWPDWRFGVHMYWYSPPLAAVGADVADGRARLDFGAVAAREVAIAKSKFGTGTWSVMLDLRAIGADKSGTATFPAGASADATASWATIEVLPASASGAGAVEPAATSARETFADRDELTVVSAELGETRKVWVRAPAPCRAGTPTTCDLLLVLDADALFPLATAYAHVMEGMGRMPPVIIVGIPSLTMGERYRNFTTSVSSDDKARIPGAEGGPRFLRFLEREVMPAVEAAYQPSSRRTLAGHSLAGLFAVDAITAGASFEGYVAISPSLSLNGQAAVERILPVLDRQTGESRRLYVSVANDGQPYVDAFTRLYAEYDKRKPAWLTTSFQRFRTEDHVTTVAPALTAAMNWLYLQRAR